MPLSVLIEFKIEPQPVTKKEIVLMQGQLEVSVSAINPVPQAIPVSIVMTIKDTGILETPPAAIIQALSKLTLYRLQEKAHNEVTSGNYTQATEHLQNLATHLLAKGERSLAKTIILEIEHIETEKTFSEEGNKRIKYGTRALLLPPEEKIL